MHSTCKQPGMTCCNGCRRLRDGSRLKNMPLYVLKSSAGVEVHVRPIGCCIQRLLVPDAQGNLEDIVLGFDDLKPYSVRAGTGAHVHLRIYDFNAAAHDAHPVPASQGDAGSMLIYFAVERLTHCSVPGNSEEPPAASYFCPVT